MTRRRRKAPGGTTTSWSQTEARWEKEGPGRCEKCCCGKDWGIRNNNFMAIPGLIWYVEHIWEYDMWGFIFYITSNRYYGIHEGVSSWGPHEVVVVNLKPSPGLSENSVKIARLHCWQCLCSPLSNGHPHILWESCIFDEWLAIG